MNCSPQQFRSVQWEQGQSVPCSLNTGAVPVYNLLHVKRERIEEPNKHQIYNNQCKCGLFFLQIVALIGLHGVV